jgi:hypothetical protein
MANPVELFAPQERAVTSRGFQPTEKREHNNHRHDPKGVDRVLALPSGIGGPLRGPQTRCSCGVPFRGLKPTAILGLPLQGIGPSHQPSPYSLVAWVSPWPRCQVCPIVSPWRERVRVRVESSLFECASVSGQIDLLQVCGQVAVPAVDTQLLSDGNALQPYGVRALVEDEGHLLGGLS